MAEESAALRDAREYVTEFVQRFGNDVVSRARVDVQRAFVKNCRKVLENCAGNLSWMIEKKPSYWPADLAFGDSNNVIKNKDELKDIVNFLVGQAKLHILSAPAQSRAPESSLAASGRQDSGAECRDWSEDDLRKRIKYNLRRFSSLDLDGQLNKRLLDIVDKWTLCELPIKGYALYLLISKLKWMLGKNPQRADEFRKQLQEFTDKESFDARPLPASVHTINCEREQREDVFKDDMCSSKSREEETSDKSEMPQLDCRKDDSWQSTTIDSESDDSEPAVELNLREDAEEEIISTNSVDCLTDKDENWDLYCLLNGDVVEETIQEQTIDHGNEEEIYGCEVARQELTEVLESFMEDPSPVIMAEIWKDVEEYKMPDVPQVPPDARYKDIAGVHVYQKNFNTLNLNEEQPDDVIIAAVLALMKRDYQNVDIFPMLLYENGRIRYKLDDEMSELKRWLLIPVLYVKHWLLLAADTREETFSILDSLPNEQLASELATWFKNLMSACTNCGFYKWKRVEFPCGCQKDANNSGLFLLMNAEVFVNQECRNIAPDLSRQCLVSDFRFWIVWKLTYADTSSSIVHHAHLQVAPEETLCPTCQEMHGKVEFLFKPV